jgi:cytochrome c553
MIGRARPGIRPPGNGRPGDTARPVRRSRGSRAAAVLAACFAAGLAFDDSAAADAAAGKMRAQACSVCHGPLGISTAPDAPNLAGQPAIYLSAQLRSFRSGERRHEVMNVIAKPLSDDDIDGIAAWFSSIRVEAKPP